MDFINRVQTHALMIVGVLTATALKNALADNYF
jgi:hypothetical protein